MATNAVRIGLIDPGRGREYIAAEKIPRGHEVVLAKPLAAVLRSEHLSTHCSTCFIPLIYVEDGNVVCDGCSCFTMCKTCASKGAGDGKSNDEMEIHLACGECFVLQEGEMLDTTTRMLLRLEHRRRKEESAKPEKGGKEESKDKAKASEVIHGLEGLDNLEQHVKQKTESMLHAYGEYVKLVLKRFRAVNDEGMDLTEQEDENQTVDDAVVERHVGWLQAIQHNQHAITDDLSGDMVGNMISPEGSLFNHSCCPNIAWSMLRDGKVRFVASHDIAEGEPLCIPYVPEHTPRHLRLEILRDKWNFECICPRCKTDDKETLSEHDALLVSGPEGLSERWRDRDLGEELEKWVSDKVEESGAESVTIEAANDEIKKILETSLGAVDGTKKELSESHWSILRMRKIAGNILLALGDGEIAAKHYRSVLEHSPDLEIHAVSHNLRFKLATALLMECARLGLCSEKQARLTKLAAAELELAKKSMIPIYGDSHWASQVVCKELEKCCRLMETTSEGSAGIKRKREEAAVASPIQNAVA